jgi:signal transduction histidine kinase
LGNALRHANAKSIQVKLLEADNCVTLQVIDDGQGFNSGDPAIQGLGLKSMSARAMQAGGSLAIQSSPGKGTEVRVAIFLEPGA